MNTISKKFISQLETKDEKEQEIIEGEILNYLINCKNKELFEEIYKYIIEEVNDLISNINDYGELEEIVKKYGKDEIIQIIKNETIDSCSDFNFNFSAMQLNYIYKINFKVEFNNFTYNYADSGDISNYAHNAIYEFIFNDEINEDIIKIFVLFFPKDAIGNQCFRWLDKYKNLY